MKYRNWLRDPAIQGSAIGHYLHLFLILLVFWFLLCGQIQTSDVLAGICFCAVISYLCFPLLLLENREREKKYFVFQVPVLRLALFGIWLLKEIVQSNLMVARAIMGQDNQIDPRLAVFRMPMDNPMAHVLLANSITLTPGTVTLEVTEEGHYTIHALNEEMARDLLSGRIQKKVASLFGEKDVMYENLGFSSVEVEG